MKRFKLLLVSLSFVLATITPIFLGTTARAATILCNRDLSLNKQVKVPGGGFVDAHSSGVAPVAHVGDIVEWKITISNVSSGPCEQFDLPGTIVMHDTLPPGFNFVSSSDSSGYDGSTNDWKVSAATVGSAGSVELTIDTTATQVGSFENAATLTSLITCVSDGEIVTCTTHNYSIDNSDDPMRFVKDQNTENDSSDAWVNVQNKPAVLGASTTTPQVLADSIVNTGSGAATNIIAGLLLLSGLAFVSYGRLFRKSHYKA